MNFLVNKENLNIFLSILIYLIFKYSIRIFLEKNFFAAILCGLEEMLTTLDVWNRTGKKKKIKTTAR